MEPKTKKVITKTEKNDTTKVEKKAAVATTGIAETAPKKVIKARIAKKDKVVKVAKVTKPVKKAKDVTPTEPIIKAPRAKVVKSVKVSSDPKPVKAAKKEMTTGTAKPKAAKPHRLSASARTYIRRLKQAARQEGTVYHAPIFPQRTSTK